jgi:hypothetical protein
MPLFGKWYDGGLRTAVGQLSLAGTSLLEHVGLLDLMPNVVQKTKETAEALVAGAGKVKNQAADLGSSALEKTGVKSVYNAASGYIRGATETAKWGACKLMETGKGEKIDCYSLTCEPGKICYSPTCPRGRNISVLSKETFQDILRGVYQVGGETTGFLKPLSH